MRSCHWNTSRSSNCRPLRNYILREELKKVRELKWSLADHGIDIFHLDGFVRLTLEGFDEPVDLLPPVVEESIERDGSVHFLINDGMHRVYMALREWVIPQVYSSAGFRKTFRITRFPFLGDGPVWRNETIFPSAISRNGTALPIITRSTGTSILPFPMWGDRASFTRRRVREPDRCHSLVS